MALLQILSIIAPIFILIALGFFAGKFHLIRGTASDTLSSYVYYFALPALLFLRTAQTPAAGYQDINFILAYSLPHIVTALLVWIVAKSLKIAPRVRSMFMLTAIFGNLAFIGIPFNTYAFGITAQPIVALTIAFTLLISTFWSLGLAEGSQLATGKKGKAFLQLAALFFKKLFTNPLFASILLGIAASSINLRLPGIIERPIDLLAQTAGPTALFALGIFFVDKRMAANFKTTFSLSLVKLIVFPLLVFAAFKFFPTDPLKMQIAIAQAAMPMGTTNFVFAQQWNAEPETVGSAIIVSTITSIVTLSALLLLI